LDSWSELPDLKYITQQFFILAAREGLPLTKQSVIERLYGDELEQMILLTYVEEALQTEAEIRAIASGICTYPPPDNSTAPFGMLPYVGREDIVGPYGKSMKDPFFLEVEVSGFAVLTDHLWSTQSIAPNILTVTGGGGFIASFLDTYHVDVIRIHLKATLGTTLSFSGDSTSPICQGVDVIAGTLGVWVDVLCLPLFEEFRFDLLMFQTWAPNCLDDVTSFKCEQFMRDTCVTLVPNGVVRLPGSLEPFLGCNGARCCVALSAEFVASSFVFISSTAIVEVDEIAIFGHGDVALPLPDGLKNLFEEVSGQSACVDEKVFLSPVFGLGGSKSYFRAGDEATANSTGIYDVCETDGGVFASNIGDRSGAVDYATGLGVACFPEGTDSECFVNARDRKEIKSAPNLEHLIHQSCTTYGCFQNDVAISGTEFSVVSDPSANPTQWNTSWFSGGLPWSDLFTSEGFVREVTSGLPEYIKWTPPVGSPSACTRAKCSCTITFFKAAANDNNFGPISPVFFGNNGPSLPDQCDAILRNTLGGLMCNPPGLGFPIANCNTQLSITVDGDNLESFLGLNLVNLTYNLQQFTSGCDKFKNHSISESRRISVSGDCSVQIENNGSVNPFKYVISNAGTVQNGGGGGELFTNSTSFWHSGVNDKLTFIGIVPKYQTTRVKLVPQGAEMGASPGTERAFMGILTHPFSCSKISLHATHSTNPGSVTLLSTPKVLISLLEDVTWAPNNLTLSTNLNGCRSNATTLCPFTIPFTPCNTTRNVRNCLSCFNDINSQFEWSQDFFFENEFIEAVDSLNQLSIVNSDVSTPNFFVDFNGEYRRNLSTLLGDSAYGHVLCSLTAARLDVSFEIDYCLVVRKNTGNLLVPFTLTPSICSRRLPVVCVRDIFKYAVQIGRYVTYVGRQVEKG